MATIVKNVKTNKRYVFLGSGFGAFQSKKPNWFFGDLVADTDEGSYAMACVCDEYGQIGWLESNDVIVESIDGVSIEQAFHV